MTIISDIKNALSSIGKVLGKIVGNILSGIRSIFSFILGIGVTFADGIQFIFSVLPDLFELLKQLVELLIYAIELAAKYIKIPVVMVMLMPLYSMFGTLVAVITAFV